MAVRIRTLVTGGRRDRVAGRFVTDWHVDYWRDRALKAEADASDLRRALSKASVLVDAGSRLRKMVLPNIACADEWDKAVTDWEQE